MQKLKAYTFVSLNGNDWSLQFHQHFQEKEREEKKNKKQRKTTIAATKCSGCKSSKVNPEEVFLISNTNYSNFSFFNYTSLNVKSQALEVTVKYLYKKYIPKTCVKLKDTLIKTMAKSSC